MSLFYVVARGIPFQDRRKKDVVVGVTASRERAKSIQFTTGIGVKKVDIVTALDGTEWLGPGGKRALRELLQAEQERVMKLLIEDDDEDRPFKLERELCRLRDAEAKLSEAKHGR